MQTQLSKIKPKPISFRDLVFVIIISLLFPDGVDNFFSGLIRSKNEPTPVVQPMMPQAESLGVQTQNDEPKPKLEITWLSSPVTRDWSYSEEKKIWITEKYNKSLRSSPSTKIGLRSDGVVVWDKKEK